MKAKGGFYLYPALAALICIVDQGIKHIVRKSPERMVFFSVPGLFELTNCTNTGAAFSIMRGQPVLISILSVLLLGILLFFLIRTIKLPTEIKALLSILIGAGSGNLIDRLFFGGVTDYIHLLWISFPVFNFADICITGSVVILSYLIITGRLDKHPEEATYESDD